MHRQFLDAEIVTISKAADIVMVLNNGNGAIDKLLSTYHDILQVNPAFMKAEIYIARSLVEGLKRF